MTRVALAFLLLGLAACGIKGDPVAPNGAKGLGEAGWSEAPDPLSGGLLPPPPARGQL